MNQAYHVPAICIVTGFGGCLVTIRTINKVRGGNVFTTSPYPVTVNVARCVFVGWRAATAF